MKLKPYLLGLLLIFAACSPEDGGESGIHGCTDPAAANFDTEATLDDCNCEYTGFTAIGTPPSSAVQNVLIEEFSGEWCGWCVNGPLLIEQFRQNNPGRVYVNVIHQGDFMENALTRQLLNQFDANIFPSAIFNRERSSVLTEGLWEGRINFHLNQTARADMAIETQMTGGNTLEGVVHVDFKENLESTNARVLVYVTENGIPAVAQQNYYRRLGGAIGHPYYDLPATLGANDYTHNDVLRAEVLNEGIASKALRAEGVFTRKFTVNMADYDAQNVQIIAVVTDGSEFNVINVMGVTAGQTADW